MADAELALILLYVCSQGTAAHRMILAFLPPSLLDVDAGPARLAQPSILVEVCRFRSQGGQATKASDSRFTLSRVIGHALYLDPCWHAEQVGVCEGGLTFHQELAEVDQNMGASCVQAAWLPVQDGPAGINACLPGDSPACTASGRQAHRAAAAQGGCSMGFVTQPSAPAGRSNAAAAKG